MELALTSRKERGSAESLSSRKAETDQGTTVARPWLRKFRKAFRSGSPGRVAPGSAEAPAPCRHSLSLPTQDPEEPRTLSGQQPLVPLEEGFSEEQRNHCAADKKRPEGNVVFPLDHPRGNEGDPDERT